MATETQFKVSDHFKGKDKALRALYDEIIASARLNGPVKQEAKKTSIHIVNRSALAGVQVRKDYLLLNLKSDHEPPPSARIHKREKLSAKRYHFEMKIKSADEVDEQLKGWIKEAYALSG
jgi:hypothetical protein